VHFNELKTGGADVRGVFRSDNIPGARLVSPARLSRHCQPRLDTMSLSVSLEFQPRLSLGETTAKPAP